MILHTFSNKTIIGVPYYIFSLPFAKSIIKICYFSHPNEITFL